VIVVNEREFNVQVIETRAQWESGLRSRLALDADGITLFLNPAFDSWLVTENWQSGAGDIVVDECGQIYWTALEARPNGERVWRLLRRNPITFEVERSKAAEVLNRESSGLRGTISGCSISARETKARSAVACSRYHDRRFKSFTK
jgi:hypothetical protein